MNKAILNRRNRERRAKRNQAELPELLEIDREAEDRLLAQIEANIAVLSEENQKRLAPKIEDIADKLKKPEKKKDKDSSVESALTAPTGSDVGAFGRPAVSAAVEEALEEEPMEFMVDAPVDAPVEDLGVPSFDMIDPSNLAGSANIIQRGRMQEAADEFEEAGAPPRDPRMRSEMFMSAAPEEFEVAAYGPAMQEVAAQELMRELEVRKGLGQSDFTDLYDEIQRGLDRVNPVGTTDGRPNKRTLERDLSVKVGGRRIPAVLANRILAEYRADYDRIRRGQALGYGHGGRRDRGVRR